MPVTSSAVITAYGVKNISEVSWFPVSSPMRRIKAHGATGIVTAQINQQRRAPVFSSALAVNGRPEALLGRFADRLVSPDAASLRQTTERRSLGPGRI
jgi:hypothetical protein